MTKTVKYLYDIGKYELMKQDLEEVKWEAMLLGKSTEEMWIIIKNKITEVVVVSHVPHKTFTGKNTKNKKPPWMNDRVRQQLKKKKSAFESTRK